MLCALSKLRNTEGLPMTDFATDLVTIQLNVSVGYIWDLIVYKEHPSLNIPAYTRDSTSYRHEVYS